MGKSIEQSKATSLNTEKICEHFDHSLFNNNLQYERYIKENIIPINLKSICSCGPVSLIFVNNTKYSKVELKWVDFEGELVSYGYLASGDTMAMNTYKTHPWIFVDSQTNRFIDFHNTDGTTEVIIRE